MSLEATLLLALSLAAIVGFVIGVFVKTRGFIIIFAIAGLIPLLLSVQLADPRWGAALYGVYGGFAWMSFAIALVAAGLGRLLRRSSGVFRPLTETEERP